MYIEAQEINDSEKVRKRIARVEAAIEEETSSESDEESNRKSEESESSEANDNEDILVIIFSPALTL